MTKYEKLQCIAGLINSLDKDIFRYEQAGKLPNPNTYHNIAEIQLIDQYFDAVKELVNKSEVISTWKVFTMEENTKRIFELTLIYLKNRDKYTEDEKRIILNALKIAQENI